MRNITVTLYKFDELPTEEAKEVARDWWRDMESQNPAWQQEHYQSTKEAMKFIDSYRMWDGVEGLEAAAVKLQGECPWTGYCADATAIDAIVEACGGLTDISEIKRRVQQDMDEAWEKECEAAMEDENVDENIIANNYEFLENGEKA
jgi:hypothetical protein